MTLSTFEWLVLIGIGAAAWGTTTQLRKVVALLYEVRSVLIDIQKNTEKLRFPEPTKY